MHECMVLKRLFNVMLLLTDKIKEKEILLAVAIIYFLSGRAVANSLYDQNSYVSMYSDQKAWHVGDNVTVYILESSVAQSKAGDTSDRKTTIGADFKTPHTEKNLDLSLSGDSDNSGSTKREGNIQARITATVVEVDKAGQLFIKGSQDILINDEKQKITLSGWLRPKDITAQNIVLSSRLASSQIDYEGYGDVTMNRKPGIIKRFFMAIGLF